MAQLGLFVLVEELIGLSFPSLLESTYFGFFAAFEFEPFSLLEGDKLFCHFPVLFVGLVHEVQFLLLYSFGDFLLDQFEVVFELCVHLAFVLQPDCLVLLLYLLDLPLAAAYDPLDLGL